MTDDLGKRMDAAVTNAGHVRPADAAGSYFYEYFVGFQGRNGNILIDKFFRSFNDQCFHHCHTCHSFTET